MKTRALVAVLIAVAALQAQAGSLPRHGLVMFTNECVSEQSDDLYGTRVTLRRIGKIDDLLLERADFSPEVIWPVRVDSAARRLSFELRAEKASPVLVEGELSGDGQTLTLKGLPNAAPDHVERLRRVTDFSRPVPGCGVR